MVKGKLTRKEIVQQDIIRKTLTSISGWILKNRVHILSAITAFFVIVVAVYLVHQSLSSRAEEMKGEFSDALAVYHAPVDTDQEDSQQDPSQKFPTKYRFNTVQERHEAALTRFQDLTTRYEGKRTGYFAIYYVGLCLLDLDRESEAKVSFETVSSNSSDKDLKNLARNSLAQLAITASDFESAIQLYQMILEEPSRNLPEQLILLRLGRSLENTGQLEAALENYRKVTSDYAGTTAASEAQNRIRKLEPRVGGNSDNEENTEPGGNEGGSEE